MYYYYNQYNANWNNPMYFPFPSANPVKTAIQKMLRKISKCVFWPIVNYQNEFNRNIVCFQNQVKYYIEDDRKKQKEYEEEILRMGEEIRQLRGEISQVREINRQLQEELLGREREEEKIGVVSRQLMDVKWKQIDYFCKEKEEDILTCKICGHQAMRKAYEKKISDCIFNGGKLERYVCPGCGVIFGPTKFSDMSQNEIDEDYQVHYYGFQEGSSYEVELEAFYMLKPDKEGIYLNYGCGCWSKSIQKLRDDGYNVYGYEPYAPEVDNPYMITSKAEISKMRFNGIYSNNLLEHLIDPVEEIRFMKSLLMNPSAKMSHSTPCYVYSYEYTRFHTHFYTGKSLEVLCDRTGMEIVDSRNGLDGQEFICYVYKMKEDSVDYTPWMYISERKEEAEKQDGSILLHNKGIIYGPYIRQGKGTYKVGVEIGLPENAGKIMFFVTADKGKKTLAEFGLSDGRNMFSYTLEEMEEDVEFFITNNFEEDIRIQSVKLY